MIAEAERPIIATRICGIVDIGVIRFVVAKNSSDLLLYIGMEWLLSWGAYKSRMLSSVAPPLRRNLKVDQPRDHYSGGESSICQLVDRYQIAQGIFFALMQIIC